MRTITIDQSKCIKCHKCVKLCPAFIFTEEDKQIRTSDTENCIGCTHCVSACPREAIQHSDYPYEKLREINFELYPSPEQMLELIQGRRSNRAFKKEGIALAQLETIVKAALCAPTATNTRNVECKIINSLEEIKAISDFTIEIFSKIAKLLENPAIKLVLKPLNKDLYKMIPAFQKILKDYEEGKDDILRGASAVILFHTPAKSRFGVQDANLAYQNASLMAESMGIAHFYAGFVCSAIIQNKQKKLNKRLGLEGRHINAGMALGLREFTINKVVK